MESGGKFGVEVEIHSAVTPDDQPLELVRRYGLSAARFRDNKYSRLEPCVATFLSHYELWWKCAKGTEKLLILEHDAVFHAGLPDLSEVIGACSLGRPSFGSFVTPKEGLGPLTSKPYFPGAHAYVVTPPGAEKLIEAAEREACPTDIFLSVERFRWLQEFYPWPVVAEDRFTTIQKEEGCKAKHNRVEIIEW